MSNFLARIVAILALPMLAACAGSPTTKEPPVVPGYEGIQEGEFFIQPVPPQYLYDGNRREQVRLAGNAVTPPAARDLIGLVAEAITGQPSELVA